MKKLARDLTNEKEALLQKAEKDAAIISRMSQEAFAKEDELARLQVSLDALQSGRPDAFVMNGATVRGVVKLRPKADQETADEHADSVDVSDEVIHYLNLKSKSVRVSIVRFLRSSHKRLKSAPHVIAPDQGQMIH